MVDLKKLKNCIGLSLKDSFINLGWNVIGDKALSNIGKRFEDLFNAVLEETYIKPNEGAEKSLDEYISDGNSIVISSSLPRDIALKVISKSGFAKVLEGRIDTAALICHDAKVDRNLGQQTIRSIAQLSRPLEFAVVIDSNARNVLAAKRVGAIVAATRSLASDIFALRSADSVVTSMSDISAKSLYSTVTKAYENSQGPSPEPAAASDADLIKLKTLQAPAIADDLPKDTFADEFGADMY